MKQLLMPDMVKLRKEFLVNYGNRLLEINGLKVGDEISTEFEYEGVSTRYKSRELDKYTYRKMAKGVLKLDADGCLYAESLDDMTFYEYVRDGKRYYYKQVNKKSVKKFGTGFIY